MIAHITVIEEDNANNLRSGSSIYEDVEVRISHCSSNSYSFLWLSPCIAGAILKIGLSLGRVYYPELAHFFIINA